MKKCIVIIFALFACIPASAESVDFKGAFYQLCWSDNCDAKARVTEKDIIIDVDDNTKKGNYSITRDFDGLKATFSIDLFGVNKKCFSMINRIRVPKAEANSDSRIDCTTNEHLKVTAAGPFMHDDKQYVFFMTLTKPEL